LEIKNALDSRSTGKPFAMWERKIITLIIAIRPSSQGSWGYPMSVYMAA